MIGESETDLSSEKDMDVQKRVQRIQLGMAAVCANWQIWTTFMLFYLTAMHCSSHVYIYFNCVIRIHWILKGGCCCATGGFGVSW